MRSLSAILACAMSVGFVSDARACWCGYSGRTARVAITRPMPNNDYCPVDWDPSIARQWGTWLVRLEAALPNGYALDAFGGTATLAAPNGVSIDVAWAELSELFERVALLGRDAARTRRARARSVRVFTVQVFASATDAGAGRVAEHVERAGAEDTGFFFAGDAPAKNPVAHVVAERGARGQRLYKVLVGAFLDRPSATAAARDLRRKAGLPAFARPL